MFGVQFTVFLSEYRRGITLINGKMLERVRNNSDFAKIFFFDQLVNNSDRGENTGNWFVDENTKKLMILDHTHVFRIGQLWNAISLKQDEIVPQPLLPEFEGSLYKILLDKIGVSAPFYSIAARWKSLDREDVLDVLKDIPDDWGISDDDLAAMEEFLVFQYEHAEDLENVLKTGLDWKGKV
ncbi:MULTISPECIES: HipA family kinase [Weissella]|uniref:HipA family kinase n=1 Tax=Weissella TaxID=46255 RepID=UPI0029CA9251|nr:HipA family kinase [Weissella sp. LMG 11983]